MIQAMKETNVHDAALCRERLGWIIRENPLGLEIMWFLIDEEEAVIVDLAKIGPTRRKIMKPLGQLHIWCVFRSGR